MDTNENIPGSLETAEITKQSAKIPSSSVKQQGGKFLPLRIVSWLYKWFQVNTFLSFCSRLIQVRKDSQSKQEPMIS